MGNNGWWLSITFIRCLINHLCGTSRSRLMKHMAVGLEPVPLAVHSFISCYKELSCSKGKQQAVQKAQALFSKQAQASKKVPHCLSLLYSLRAPVKWRSPSSHANKSVLAALECQHPALSRALRIRRIWHDRPSLFLGMVLLHVGLCVNVLFVILVVLGQLWLWVLGPVRTPGCSHPRNDRTIQAVGMFTNRFIEVFALLFTIIASHWYRPKVIIWSGTTTESGWPILCHTCSHQKPRPPLLCAFCRWVEYPISNKNHL